MSDYKVKIFRTHETGKEKIYQTFVTSDCKNNATTTAYHNYLKEYPNDIMQNNTGLWFEAMEIKEPTENLNAVIRVVQDSILKFPIDQNEIIRVIKKATMMSVYGFRL